MKLKNPIVTWVNHASYILSYDGINLITDPWLFGSAFNNGWELISKTKFSTNDFDKITHIWFSHEHPDHFSPPVLKTIPENFRKKITVLFHQTRDHRILDYCKSLGFSTIEMDPDQNYTLTPNVIVKCRPIGILDSWLFTKIEDTKILNVNDCVINSEDKAEKILTHTGHVDVLLTQFSYAQWAGNPENVERRISEAKEKISRIKIQARVLKPKFLIPFASFVRFSHVDNSYINKEMNKIDKVTEIIENETNSIPIVLYPGDQWEVGEEYNNDEALKKYLDDFDLSRKELSQSPTVPIDELCKISDWYIDKIHKNNNSLILKLFYKIKKLKTAKVFLKDLKKPFYFDLIHGIREGAFDENQSDIITDSDSLAFAMKFGWGGNTLGVNGRYRTAMGDEKIFFENFWVDMWNNAGYNYSIKTYLFFLKKKLILSKFG